MAEAVSLFNVGLKFLTDGIICASHLYSFLRSRLFTCFRKMDGAIYKFSGIYNKLRGIDSCFET